MKITFDVTDRLETILLALLGCNGATHYEISQIKRRLDQIMGAIDNLKAAVDQEITATQSGFDSIGSALQELSSDIANLPQAADVQAEADRLSSNAQTISNAFNSASEQIRDALPTEAPATGGTDTGSTGGTDSGSGENPPA